MIDRLFNKHKLVRRVVLLWVMYLVTITVKKFLEISGTLPNAHLVFISIIGLLSVAIGLYQWDRARDDK